MGQIGDFASILSIKSHFYLSKLHKTRHLLITRVTALFRNAEFEKCLRKLSETYYLMKEKIAIKYFNMNAHFRKTAWLL